MKNKWNTNNERRVFCTHQYDFDNECKILEYNGIEVLIEYVNWKNVNGSNLRVWVTKDKIRKK